MTRISIDVTDEQHRKLKTVAALKGITLKELLLGDMIREEEDDPAMDELIAFLNERAKNFETSPRTIEQIFDEAIAQCRAEQAREKSAVKGKHARR